MPTPTLIDCYKRYGDLVEEAKNAKKLNLEKEDILYPTTLLPLAHFIRNNRMIEITKPVHTWTKHFLEVATGDSGYISSHGTYFPATLLPKDQKKADEILNEISIVNDRGKDFGGENVLRYLMGEMVANIYDHSSFTHSWLMIEKYPEEQCLEMCFFDDGITIPGSYAKSNVPTNDDLDALTKATNGRSTKGPERGFGIPTSINLATKGLNGEFLLISKGAGLHFARSEKYEISLTEKYILEGTLVGIRIPYTNKEIDIYKYIERGPNHENQN